MPDTVHVGERQRLGYVRYDPEAELAKPPPVEPLFDEPIEAVRARVAAEVGKVRIDRDLTSPHPVVRNLLADDEKRRLKPGDAPWRLRLGEPLFASAFEKRRLRVLNSIFTALQKFGAAPWVSDDEARKIGVDVGVQRVDFLLDHPSAKPDRNGQWRTREGWADELCLTIEGEGEQSWSDSEEHGLEVHLTEIVVQLIVAGELRYRAAARAAHEWALRRRREHEQELVRRRAEALRKAREARIAAERAHRAQLLAMAADLRAADDIRNLVSRAMAARDEAEEGASSWAAWSLEVADRLDPVSRLIIDETGVASLAEPAWAGPADGEGGTAGAGG